MQKQPPTVNPDKVTKIGLQYFPIIYREAGKELTDPCPYCDKEHQHSQGAGHRAAHCRNGLRKRLTEIGGFKFIAENDGYVIVEYTNT